MTGQTTVASGERGVVRVFAINAPKAQVAEWEKADIETALGAPALDHDYVDFVEARTLLPLGVSGYLVEGLGLEESAVAAERARLDALDGYVAVVASPAFKGMGAALEPKEMATLIACFTEAEAQPSFDKLTSEGAKGALRSPKTSADQPAAPARASGVVVKLLVVAALLVAFLVLVR